MLVAWQTPLNRRAWPSRWARSPRAPCRAASRVVQQRARRDPRRHNDPRLQRCPRHEGRALDRDRCAGRWSGRRSALDLREARDQGAVLVGAGAPRLRDDRPPAGGVRRLSLHLGLRLPDRDRSRLRRARTGDRSRGPGVHGLRCRGGQGRRRTVEACAGLVPPRGGGVLFALLIVVVLTSAGWYLNEYGWPSR